MHFFGYLKRDKVIRQTLILLVLVWVLLSIIFGYGFESFSDILYERQQTSVLALITLDGESFSQTSRGYEAFILSSDSVTNEEFYDYCSYLCTYNHSITLVSWAPGGYIEYVSPQTYVDQLVGVDVIQSFSTEERAAFTEASLNNHMFTTYDSTTNELTYRLPVMNGTEFVGLFSITYDLDEYATFLDLPISSDSIHYTIDNHHILSNNSGDYRLTDTITIDGITYQISTDYNAYQSESMYIYFIAVNLILIVIFAFIFILIFYNHKKLSSYMAFMDYSESFSVETGLKNRQSLYRDFEELHKEMNSFFIAYGIFNNVKFINYKYGYTIGSNVVKEAIRLISGVVREGTQMYHIGGDEYALLIQTDSLAEVKNILQRILRVFERDIVIKSIRTNISLSLGVVSYPAQGATIEELIKNANLALSQSKIINTNNYALYGNQDMSNIIGNQDFDIYISKLDFHRFKVFFMPIVDVQTDHIVGFECLSRAFNEFDEMIETGAVINSLERSGKIEMLDSIVFHKVLEYMSQINKLHPKNDLFLSVNVSALSLNDNFVDNVIHDFEQFNLKQGTIVIELTESYKVEDYEYLIRLFKRLNQVGIKTAVDDFGSGYSSLSYISKFPIYTIKVDKAYVRDYDQNEFNRTLFFTLQSIAEVLKCKLVAEGVDDPDTLRFLRENNAEWYQGFLFSKGVSFEEAMDMIVHPKNRKQ